MVAANVFTVTDYHLLYNNNYDGMYCARPNLLSSTVHFTDEETEDQRQNMFCSVNICSSKARNFPVHHTAFIFHTSNLEEIKVNFKGASEKVSV